MDKLRDEIRNSKYTYTMEVADELNHVLSTKQNDDTWILFALVLKYMMQRKANELQYCLMRLSGRIKKSPEFIQEDKDFLNTQLIFLKEFKQRIIRQISLINGVMFLAFCLFAFLFMKGAFEIPVIMIVLLLMIANTFIMYQRILRRSTDADTLRLEEVVEDEQLLQYIQEYKR